MPHAKNSFEGLPELWIEDCVDDGIDTGVYVAKESGGEEGGVARGGVDTIFDMEGVKDVAGEEGDPTDQETC